MKPRFGYWPVQARGNACRMALHYLAIDYQDDVLGANWGDLKFNLGLDFPNLPYYCDGDVNITQSTSILRYIGKKHGLHGKTLAEEAKIDMLIETAQDVMLGFASQAYDHSVDLKADHLKTNGPKLQQLNDFLEGKNFLVGDGATVADFAMYHPIWWHMEVGKEAKQECPYSNIVKWIEKLESLPKIKSFLGSEKHFPACLAAHSQWRPLKM